jgi:hypothetical protein
MPGQNWIGGGKSGCGTSRHFVAMQQFSRFPSEADIDSCEFTAPEAAQFQKDRLLGP